MAARPSSRGRTRSADRRADLVEAALASFVAKGVNGASVDDIVAAAGVAKGTFYLYFGSKDEIVNAVAERMVARVGDEVEAAAGAAGLDAVGRLRSLGAAIAAVGGAPHEQNLIDIFHRPENLAVHDRMADQVIVRLAPTLERIVAEGVAAGAFLPQDPRLAAAFVLGCFSRLHDVVGRPQDAAGVLEALDDFVLRGLGYTGEIEA